MIETLATLAEAGFGFDASIAELLETQHGDVRPIHDELRLYQLECQTGAGRAACLKRMDGRIGLPAVAGLVQALLQAEEAGSGLAGVLRPQAEELRQQRRERALARAEEALTHLWHAFLQTDAAEAWYRQHPQPPA